MIFNYTAIDSKTGEKKSGGIDTASMSVAINSLQKRGFVVTSIEPGEKKLGLHTEITLFQRVSNRDIVILSRQMATLFEAQVSALEAFKLLGAEASNPLVRNALESVSQDVQGGATISHAFSKFPKVFSPFYVSMVKVGEESGQLDKTFIYLADHLERAYAITSKARNALVYPLFVIIVFIAVMGLMFTTVIPQISEVLLSTGQDLPIYTKLVMGVSEFFVNFWWLMIGGGLVGLIVLWKYLQTTEGKLNLSKTRLATPYLGALYQKLALARIADNMTTMIKSGIPIVRAIEITSEVVHDEVYTEILLQALEEVRGGSHFSAALSGYKEVPAIFVQMARVGEETGGLGKVLETLATFYEREVETAVDTLVSLIEPAMIVVLGLGVGILLASVLMPIYNLASGF